MATDIISSKIYKLLDELNIPNEDIEMRPQVVEKIIDLIWNNTLITDRGSSQSGVAPTPKVRPLTINNPKWTGVSTPSKTITNL